MMETIKFVHVTCVAVWPRDNPVCHVSGYQQVGFGVVRV